MVELSFFTSFYLHRFSGLHQQPLLFLCAVLCGGGECQSPSSEPFFYMFVFFFLLDLLTFLLQVIITKWSVPCPLPNNVTAVSNDLQVEKTNNKHTFVYLCSLQV